MKRLFSHLVVGLLAALTFASGSSAAPKPILPLSGEMPVLVILQCYKDVTPTVPKVPVCGKSFDALRTADGPRAPGTGNLWDYSPRTLAHPDLYDRIFFGPRPSTADYFRELSYGKFSIKKAAILPSSPSRSSVSGGWYVAPKTEAYYWGGTDDTRHREKRAAALQQADLDFNYAAYDKDGDGTVSTDELAIVIVMAHGTDWDAVVRRAADSALATNDGVTVQPLVAEVYAFGAWFSRVAHELGHSMRARGDSNLDDLYDGPPYPTNAKQVQDFSLMGLDWLHPHLDPWHKAKLGWLAPTVVKKDGTYAVRDAETNSEAFILRDPCHTSAEYFLVENRWPGSSYDAGLPGAPGIPSQGLAIWHIDETKSAMRDVITLERSWSGAFRLDLGSWLALWRWRPFFFLDPWPTTSYAFTDTSSPRTSRWETSTSGIEIKGFSAAGPTMTVTFVTRQDDYDALAVPVERKRTELEGLRALVESLQSLLSEAPPPAKGAIVRKIIKTQTKIVAAEAELERLEGELAAFCR